MSESTAAGSTSLCLPCHHLIGEYARHNRHADLVRESLDGVTGA
ncbi:mycothiol transferase [Terrabacter terrigena]|uniref:DUF664 domain-containing protein n=1 Tax=Terrabacter terrigena TaxID=574718 RepID=A0ABW3MTF2_9MICO